jgi:sec-independent protein translocase protein TatA
MFDPSAPHIIILLIVVLVLFGAKRLPGAAKSLGESMHIFKKSVSGLNDDDAANPSAANPAGSALAPSFPPAAPIAAPGPDMTQQQLIDLQRQVAELQARSASGNGQPAETQTSQPL